MAAIFIRLCAVLAAYALAILVASLFLHMLAWPSLGFDGETPSLTARTALVVSVPLVALFISYYAFLPASVLIALAELRPYRSWLYFAISGGLTAVSAVALYQAMRLADIDNGMPASHPAAETLGGGIAAGMAAGIAYWLVAGRGAGRWRSRPISPGPSIS